jgi:hypothetical protein
MFARLDEREQGLDRAAVPIDGVPSGAALRAFYQDRLPIVTDGCGVDLRVNAWSWHGLQRRDRMMTKADGRRWA